MITGAERQAATGRILIVEDDTDSAEMLKLVLESAGHEVIWSATGGAAFEALSASTSNGSDKRLDIVLLDLTLPDMDGVEMIKNLLKSGTSVPPVIVTSAISNHLAEKAARSIGAAAVLVKPFSISNLLDTINGILDFGF